MKHNPNRILALIEDRRTIYLEKYSTQKVSEEIIAKLLDAAKWAPTHRYTQPWSFTIFMENGLQKLADFQSKLYRTEKRGNDFSQEKCDKLKNRPLLASVIIGIGMKRDENQKDPIEEEIASVAMAV